MIAPQLRAARSEHRGSESLIPTAPRTRLRSLWTALAVITFLHFPARSAEPEPSAKRSGDVTQARVLKEADSGENWLVNGGRFGGEHFSPLTQIDRTNVMRLGLAWVADIPSALGLNAEVLVVDGVAYLSGPFSLIFALNAETGTLLWQYDPKVRLDLSKSSSAAARYNRGVAVWDGTVYVGTADCRVVAIDAASGEKRWETNRICDPTEGGGTGITGAPRVGAGKVFVGYLAAGAHKARGSLVALDAKSGEELWRFWTVPGDPARGFEGEHLKQASKTWTGGFAKKGGGTVWEAIRYDPVTGFVIFGTASTVPFNAKLRGPGDNLFTNCVMAVDAETGAYRWHYQTVPSDAWGYDATMPLIVTDLEFAGKKRRVVMQVPKNGFLYLLDAHTGELLAADPISKVTWATHVDLETGRPVEVAGARYYESNEPNYAVRLFPSGVTGAHSWHAMSYSPLTRLLYIPVIGLPTTFSVGALGGRGARVEPMGYGPEEEMPPDVGKLVAWDPARRERRWAVDYPMPMNGGVLSTAGGLVFQGTATGELAAYDAGSGARFWAHKTGSSIQAAPVSYRVGGEQYVAVAVGHTGGLGNLIPTRSTGPDAWGPPRVLAYKLDASVELQLPEPRRVPVPRPPSRTASAAQVERGARLFQESCETCHGARGIGVGERRLDGAIPDLRYMPPEVHAEWHGIVLGGNRRLLGMLSFAGSLNAEDSEALHAFVIEQAWKAYEKSLTRAARQLLPKGQCARPWRLQIPRSVSRAFALEAFATRMEKPTG